MNTRFFAGLLMISTSFAFSQNQLVSFEISEGYTLSPIENQNSWSIWGGGNTNSMIVSNSHSSHGNQSLFINSSEEILDDYGVEKIVESYPHTIVEFDVRILELGKSDYSMTLFNDNYDFLAGLNFTSEGSILVYDHPIFNFKEIDNTYSNNEWIRIKLDIDFDNSELKYFINDELVLVNYLESNWEDFDRINFSTDDFGSGFYIDHLVIRNADSMEITDQSSQKIRLYPNPIQEQFFIKSEFKINSMRLYDLLGKEVLEFNSNDSFHSLKNINKGVYFLKVKGDNQLEVIKILKK